MAMGQLGDVVDRIDEAGHVAGGGDGDVVHLAWTCAQQGFKGVQRDRSRPLRRGFQPDVQDLTVGPVGQVVGMMLHGGHQRQWTLRPATAQRERESVGARRRTSTHEKRNVLVARRTEEIEHDVAGPGERLARDLRREMRARVGIGLMDEELASERLGRAHHERRGGGIQVDPTRSRAARGVAGVQTHEVGGEAAWQAGAGAGRAIQRIGHAREPSARCYGAYAPRRARRVRTMSPGSSRTVWSGSVNAWTIRPVRSAT